jgi:hypothetical protein
MKFGALGPAHDASFEGGTHTVHPFTTAPAPVRGRPAPLPRLPFRHARAAACPRRRSHWGRDLAPTPRT